MIKELCQGLEALKAVRGSNPHSLALMEGPTNCNRAGICSYCTVPDRWRPEDTSTLSQTFRQIDWLWDQGFRVLNYVGGEPLAGCQFEGGVETGKYGMCEFGKSVLVMDYTEKLAPFTTKEGNTFVKHTVKIIEYASKKGMLTNVTTNGDFLDNMHYLYELREAGLDILAFSAHSDTDTALRNLVAKARVVAREGIIPVISKVFTAERAKAIPRIARTCAANGILFSTAVVQEIGGGFSSIPTKSQIPSMEQQREVFEELLPLKKKGFIRNNLEYLIQATDFPSNSWKCDPEKDAFIHIRAQRQGEIGICSEVRTGFYTDEMDLKSDEWRNKKRALVEKCKGCLYSCHFESENSNLRGDFRTLLNMALIKSGHYDLVLKLGKRAVQQYSDVIDVPRSELEEHQEWIKDYFSVRNIIKRRGLDLTKILVTPFIFAATLAAFAVLSLQAARKGISQDELRKTLFMGVVYPGFGDVDIEPEEKPEEDADEIDTSKFAAS